MSDATLAEVENEEERLFRAELMLKSQVYLAWMQACIKRVEELGGKLEV